MKRTGTKKSAVERRKTPRGKSSSASSRTARTVSRSASPAKRASVSENIARCPQKSSKAPRNAPAKAPEDACYHCAKDLSGEERALFVEEEIGRVFCSETCITGHFGPEIERMEKEYQRRIPAGDLSAEERESYAYLRWITLQESDEIWREKTLTGDYRYTLVSEFQPGQKRIWCICICLFLRGEPSFLYIAFTTKSASFANAYRRGERVRLEKSAPRNSKAKKSQNSAISRSKRMADEIEDAMAAGNPGRAGVSADSEPTEASESGSADLGDRLADAWTEDETFLAQMNQRRSQDDIPAEEFELFQSCLEETLEAPDEVWSVEMSDPEGVHLYHFIREYSAEKPGHWYVIVARETDNEEQIEILDAFPTRDMSLVERYRRGTQEVGEASDTRSASRLVH